MKHALRGRKPAIFIIALLMLSALLLSACDGNDVPVEPTEDRRGSTEETGGQTAGEEDAEPGDAGQAEAESENTGDEAVDAEADVPLVPSVNAGGVAETYEETWDYYLLDSVAFQVRRMQDRVRFAERYQNPAQLAANTGGTMADVELIEDRSEFQLSNNDTFAQSTVDFDIRVTYLDGDSVRFRCQYLVQIEKEAETGLWYVINPRILEVTTFCG